MKINIFYGPKKGFENKIPSEIMTLEEFVLKYDNKKKTVVKTDDENDYFENTEKENIECLVAFSESYAGITESAVLSFNNLLNECDINEVYLQNPPKSIVKLIEEHYGEVNYEFYQYKKLDKKDFLKINEEFDNRIIGQEKAKEKY